jgi:hypothetical protein
MLLVCSHARRNGASASEVHDIAETLIARVKTSPGKCDYDHRNFRALRHHQCQQCEYSEPRVRMWFLLGFLAANELPSHNQSRFSNLQVAASPENAGPRARLRAAVCQPAFGALD